jgi:hypothetical protein
LLAFFEVLFGRFQKYWGNRATRMRRRTSQRRKSNALTTPSIYNEAAPIVTTSWLVFNEMGHAELLAEVYAGEKSAHTEW